MRDNSIKNTTQDTLPFILIVGPTGVGKSDFACSLASLMGNGEIVNADLGQFYTPLTIGTAKPAWREESIRHHGYDIIDSPRHYNASSYRTYINDMCIELKSRGKIPLIVGGSSFYWNSLFFPPRADENSNGKVASRWTPNDYQGEGENLWDKLYQIDPDRARMLHKQDIYRIGRALDIWCSQGILPSSIGPVYNPLSSSFHIIYLNRPRQELYQRINLRVHQMMNQGWRDEVNSLNEEWKSFVCRKKIIGYDDIIFDNNNDSEHVIEKIQQRTRNYAKRQDTYWRSWKKKLEENIIGGYSEMVLVEGDQKQSYPDKLVAFLKQACGTSIH